MSRASQGGTIVRKDGHLGVVASVKGRNVWVGAFDSIEDANAARALVKEAMDKGLPPPRFPPRLTCKNCRQKGHRRNQCKDPPRSWKLDREALSAVYRAGALKMWKRRARKPAAKPPACYLCFRVGHTSERCPKKC